MSDISPEYDIIFAESYNLEERKSEIDSLYKSYNAIISNNGDISDLQKTIHNITSKQDDYLDFCANAFDETIKDLNDKGQNVHFGDIADVCIENGLNCLVKSQSLSSYEENDEKFVESKIEQQQFEDFIVASVVNYTQKIDNTLSSTDEKWGFYGDNYAIGGLINDIRDNASVRNLYDDVVVEHAKNCLPTNKSILDVEYYGVSDVFKEITDSDTKDLSSINRILDNKLNGDVLSSNELKSLFALSITSSTTRQPILDDYAVYASSYYRNDEDSAELEKDLFDIAALSKNASKHSSISDAIGEMITGNRNQFNTSALSKFYGEVTPQDKSPLLNISENLYKKSINDTLYSLDKPKETSDFLISVTSKGLINEYGISSELNFVKKIVSEHCDGVSKTTADFYRQTINNYFKSTGENNINYKPEIIEGLLRSIGELENNGGGEKYNTNNKLSILNSLKDGTFKDSYITQRKTEEVIKDVIVSADDLTVMEKVETLTQYLNNFDEKNENKPVYKKAIDSLLSDTNGDRESIVAQFKSLDELANNSENPEEYKESMEKLLETDKLTPEDVLKTLEDCKSPVAEKMLRDKITKMVDDGLLNIDPFALDIPLFKDNKEIGNLSLNAGNWYEKIIKYGFEGSNIIDVISDYGWMNNDVWKISNGNADSFSKLNNIPYCYVTEYKQLYNSSITNIIASLIGGVSSTKHIMNNAGDVLSNITSQFGDIGKRMSGMISSAADYISTPIPDSAKESISDGYGKSKRLVKETYGFLKEKVGNIAGNIINFGNGPISAESASELLYPYRLMYILDKTDKKYCFPMLDKSSSSFGVSNKMEEGGEGAGSFILGNKLTETIGIVTKSLMGVSQDLGNIAPFFENVINGSSNQIKQYNIERSKFFSYPTDGESIDINFMLFNTVKKDIWRKHYRFILGFVLRNLPFKQDMVSYYPPLFYDVIIPGIKRCPFCYVESINVNPLGLIRTLKLSGRELHFNDDTKIKPDASFSINVPEAWQISIKFKSLIGFSSNQILSGLIDSPITGNLL